MAPVSRFPYSLYKADAKARAMLPEIHFKPTLEDVLFLGYVEDFWTPSSACVKERAFVSKHPLSAYYVQMNHDDVKRHLHPYPGFNNKRLKDRDLEVGLLQNFVALRPLVLCCSISVRPKSSPYGTILCILLLRMLRRRPWLKTWLF
jgi:hypothetical protein